MRWLTSRVAWFSFLQEYTVTHSHSYQPSQGRADEMKVPHKHRCVGVCLSPRWPWQGHKTLKAPVLPLIPPPSMRYFKHVHCFSTRFTETLRNARPQTTLKHRDVSHNNGWIMYHLHWAVQKQKCEEFPVEASKKSSRWKCMNKTHYSYVNNHDLSEQNCGSGWSGIDWIEIEFI